VVNMARPEADFQKKMMLADLNPGDKVKLTDGQIAEFKKLKQKNFDGNIDGKPYSIPINMAVEVVEKIDRVEEESKKLKEAKTLKKDELFYIEKNDRALLFKFETMERGRIIGINPIDNSRTRIDVSLYAGKVADI